MIEERKEFLDFALRLAEAAADEIMPRYRRAAVSLKADGSEVTEADRRAEEVMRRMIEKHFPDHAILGEEFGASGEGRRRWVLDPVDGTTAFTLGLPMFGTLVALVEEGDPVVGVIHMPALGETVYAAHGAGCWLRDGTGEAKRLRVAPAVGLREAFVCTTGVHSSDIQPASDGAAYNLTAVARRARKFRFFGDCVQHALVAKGMIDAGIDTAMQPWDIAALVPCVEEAGGAATSLSGRREDILNGGSLLTSSGGALHEELLECLQGARR